MSDDVAEKVKKIIAEQMGVSDDQLGDRTSLVNDLGADSLDAVELVMNIEDAFDINIPDEEAEKLQTVGDAVKYVEEHT